MIEISLNNVKLNYGINEVLKNINFEVKTNDKIALIGENGCGKSTILKLIIGSEKITSGDVFIRKNSKIAYLSQENNSSLNELLVKDILYSSFNELSKLKEKLDIQEKTMISNPTEKEIAKYSDLQEEYIRNGGYEIYSKIDKIINSFNISFLLDKKYKYLSGGEKRIIDIICIILKEADVLLLDEVTNHLDIEMLEYLESYLKNYKGTIVMVSHDRYFMDRVINKTILIEDGNSYIFNGNYSYYLEENKNRLLKEENDFKNYEREKQQLQKSAKRLREFARKTGTGGEIFYKRAKSIEKKIEKMKDIKKPYEKKIIPFNIVSNYRSGKDVLIIKKLNISYGDKKIFNNANMELFYKERVCIIGSNGSGKSTLIKEILKGNDSIKMGSNVKIGYIPQNILFSNENKTIFQYARDYFVGTDNQLRSALDKFLFNKNDIFKRIFMLSGGEKVRLKLFQLMQEESNLLVLDEVTNHVDITTKEVLESVISNYNGTVLFISHDRYFINSIATRIISIDNNKLISYIGNYDDYKMHNCK